MSEEVKLTIGNLSQLTGVNTITLRAWERRYGLLKPLRTPKGHRLYSELEVGRVREIRFWLDKGISISKVRPYLTNVHSEITDDKQCFSPEVTELLAATIAFNVNKLSTSLDNLISLYPMDVIMEGFLPAFNRALNKHAAISLASTAEHDFFYVQFRQKIRHLIAVQKPRKLKGACLLARTGQPYEPLHLLAIASMLLVYGIDSLVIEASIQMHEVPEIVSRLDFRWVLLYSDHSGPSIASAKYLKEQCKTPITIVTEERAPWQGTGMTLSDNKLDSVLQALEFS